MGLSVVIPVAAGDESWKLLLPDLKALCEDDEIILSSPISHEEELSALAKENELNCQSSWVFSQSGRARQLNTGARLTTKEFIWFLHCDSKVPPRSIERLKVSIQQNPSSIHYFDLLFLDDGPSGMWANNYGVWIRSHLFRLPFGDQGFCLRHEIFEALGGFCEETEFGEDHLLIWRAHQQGVKIRSTGVPLYTSARRYQLNGWAVTTAGHLFLTVSQAAPEFLRLLRQRMSL